MAEAAATILTSPNALLCIGGVIAIIILIAYISKQGLLSFKGKGLTVGRDSIERTVIRQQIEFVRIHTEIMSNQLIHSSKNADEWRIRYLSELIEDVWIDAISFNHITKDTFYIENKFNKVWSIIIKETSTEQFQNDDFKKVIFDTCKEVIEKLVDIKDYYGK